jgi:uncharacterized protein YecE (DUF72 family)
MTKPAGTIRAGIGGWTYPPWRGVFYPEGLAHAKELAYASSHLTSIEINGTFYRLQPPASFRHWAQETPENFVFSVKAPRFVTHRRVLAEAGDGIRRFIDSGLTELGDRLGPVLWQFAPTKTFEAADFAAFLELLPTEVDHRRLRHAVEVRHETFRTLEFASLLRRFAVSVVYTDHATHPGIADVTGDFVYLRLQQGKDSIPTGYPAKELDAWAERVQTWAAGREPAHLPRIEPRQAAKKIPRDVFVYFIHEGKLRAPAAAQGLIARLTR